VIAAVLATAVLLGGQYGLLDNGRGGTLACTSSVDSQNVPRMRCGVAVLRGGNVVGLRPHTYAAEMSGDHIAVFSTDNPTTAALAQREPASLAPVFGPFRLAPSGGSRPFLRRLSYGFAGTSVQCSTTSSGLAVACYVVDGSKHRVPRSYGFVLGFAALRVERVAASGRTSLVRTFLHGSA
jgi:hypothetical protein